MPYPRTGHERSSHRDDYCAGDPLRMRMSDLRRADRLLGGTVEVHPQGYATLHTPEGLALDFLPVPEPKTGKNRLHLDLRSRDLATAIEQALALGATRADDVYAGGRWQVLRDPEGNEFCLLRPRA
jgi:hypothetical protein